jgi:hypothetical protein
MKRTKKDYSGRLQEADRKINWFGDADGECISKKVLVEYMCPNIGGS